MINPVTDYREPIKTNNLNLIQLKNDGNYPNINLKDNSIFMNNFSIIFRNHKQILLEKIKNYNLILGCVAWVTDLDILKALSLIKNVCLVIQKEDFLRSDYNDYKKDWANILKKHYNDLKCELGTYDMLGLFKKLNVCNNFKIEPIRSVGNYNNSNNIISPKMHNKFLIFGNNIKTEEKENNISFDSIWTGSYNLTETSYNSLENSLIIKHKETVEAYYNEFCQIYAISEELDWRHVWVAPEFRIGT